MLFESTRRTFLRLSALGLASTATSSAVAGLNYEAPDDRSVSKIETWVSDPQLRCAKSEAISWQPSSAKSSEAMIVLNPGKKFQAILGFGAAFTDAACYMFNQLAGSAREQLFHLPLEPVDRADGPAGRRASERESLHRPRHGPDCRRGIGSMCRRL